MGAVPGNLQIKNLQSKTKSPSAWWQQPLVIHGHSLEFKKDIDAGPAAIERLTRWKRQAGFNVEHLLVNYSMFEGKGGESATAFCFKNFHGYCEDWLGDYLKITRKHGLRVLLYFNCHWFKPDAFPADHYVVDAAGKPKVIYGDGGEVCCRGPFRDWSERMAEDMGRYDIDGVFLDGPVKDSCWCPHCRGAFEAKFHRALPESPAACPPDLLTDYEEFLTEMPVGYMESFARGLHKHCPEGVVYCNGGDARQTRASLPWTQLVGDEGGFIGYGPINGEFPFGPGLVARQLEYRARGRARVVFCDQSYKVYDWYLHPRGEVARMYAGTVANGAAFWGGVSRAAIKAPASVSVMALNRLVTSQVEALTDTQSLAEAAIVESQLNRQLAGAVHAASGDDVHKSQGAARRLAVARHGEEFRGLYAAMARSGYPFDVVEEELLREGGLPARIKLLVLPGLSAMSEATAEAVRQFVARGGKLLATFDPGLFDEQGGKRKDSLLAGVLGASLTGDLVGPSGMDYLAITGRHALTAGMSQKLLPCPEYWMLPQAAKGVQAPLHFHERIPRRYAMLPPVSKNPAALVHRFGKGQVVYFPSTIGDLYLRYRFPEMRLLLKNAARFLAPPPIEIEGGDEFIEATLRQSGAGCGTVVAHLINWASGERPSHQAIPLGPLKVTVRLPRGAKAGKSVLLAMSGKKVPAAVKGNRVSFVVPRIEEYEMAVLK